MRDTDRAATLKIAALLLGASVIAYVAHYLIFRDPHTIFLYLVMDIAFLPISVLVVGVIIERLLARRERRNLRNKLNMVIGAFFAEVGNGLLVTLTPAMGTGDALFEHLAVHARWKPHDFSAAADYARGLDCSIDLAKLDLVELRSLLDGHRDFMVRLLENPLLLEHTRFTGLLWAIFHLCEELDHRPQLHDLPAADIAHLTADTRRVYGQLAATWVEYAGHLKDTYPFLFALVARTHPFQENPSAIVTTPA